MKVPEFTIRAFQYVCDLEFPGKPIDWIWRNIWAGQKVKTFSRHIGDSSEAALFYPSAVNHEVAADFMNMMRWHLYSTLLPLQMEIPEGTPVSVLEASVSAAYARVRSQTY